MWGPYYMPWCNGPYVGPSVANEPGCRCRGYHWEAVRT